MKNRKENNNGQLLCVDTHDDIMDVGFVNGEFIDGHFVIRLAFSEWLSTTEGVACYEFPVIEAVNDFLNGGEFDEKGKLSGKSQEEGLKIIKELEAMIANIKENLPNT